MNLEIWWQSLEAIQKVYFCIGLAATVFLILQIITLLFGFGTDEIEVDLSGDGDADASIDVADGFTLFSIRGIVAFFAIGGWVGYILAPVNSILAIACSLLAGSLALVGMAFIMRAIMRLRSSGNIEKEKAIGSLASVYLTVPPKGEGFGKVNLTLEERYVEINAVQNGEQVIPTGSQVKVVGVLGENLIVEKID